MQLVIDSKFRPFSYDELIKPLAQYKETYDKVEADYSTLAAQAEQWKNIVNQTQSPKAYMMYKKYSDELNNIVDDFSKGMTIQNRSQLSNMKKRYASDIAPIATAATRKKELADEQRKISLQDPTRIWQYNADDLSLDSLIENPFSDYGQSLSGAAITAQVEQSAAALAKELRNDPSKLNSIAGDQYFEYIKQRGFSSQDILDAIQRNPNASPVLINLVNSVIESTGVKNWGNQNALQQVTQAANRGLWKAVGEAQVEKLDNKDYMTAAQKLQYQKLLKELQGENNDTTDITNVAVNPVPIYTNNEKSNDQTNARQYSKYFYRDKKGGYRMNFAGWQEYNRRLPRIETYEDHEGIVHKRDLPGSDPTAFRKFMDSIGANKIKGYAPGRMGNMWAAALKQGNKDLKKYTEFDYAVATSEQQDLKNKINVAIRGNKLKSVNFDNKTERFIRNYEDLDEKDLASDDYKVLSIRVSPYGNTVLVKDGDGKTKRYLLPEDINSTNQKNINVYTQYIKALQNATEGKVMLPDDYARLIGQPIGTSFTATEEQINKEYTKALNQLYLFISQLSGVNKTKPQEFEQYGY